MLITKIGWTDAIDIVLEHSIIPLNMTQMDKANNCTKQ